MQTKQQIKTYKLRSFHYISGQKLQFLPHLEKTNNLEIFYQELPMKHNKINFIFIGQMVLKL